jgi:16S rRNA (uracil1498-N3)-methyltransferase
VRAIFCADLRDKDKVFSLDQASLHHLASVIRVRVGEEILAFDGQGARAVLKVSALEKRFGQVEIKSLETLTRPTRRFNLVIGMPKKEFFEDILRSAVELGISKIIPIESKFSQKTELSSERLNRILEGALIQSNNPFLPEIMPEIALAELGDKLEERAQLVLFHRQMGPALVTPMDSADIYAVIGPEGGFTDAEAETIASLPGCLSIALPTPILRSVTAVPAALGYIMGRISN